MSVPASTLRKLAALNLDAAQMAGVLDILADGIEAEEARKEAQRERTRRARDKQRRNVTVTRQQRDGHSDDTRGGVTRVEDKTSNSEIEPQEKKVRGAKRGTRLDADMALPVDWREWAVNRGLPPERVPVEFEKLRNWAANAGSKGVKSDWFRAWQNWVIEAIDRLPRNRAPPKPETMAERATRLANEIIEARNVRPSESSSSVRQAVPELSLVSGGRS